jgi:hypothetical protein
VLLLQDVVRDRAFLFGEVLITGRQLDASNELRFNSGVRFPGDKRTELTFATSDIKEWRYGPPATVIGDDGCFAFRIEGELFRRLGDVHSKGHDSLRLAHFWSLGQMASMPRSGAEREPP